MTQGKIHSFESFGTVDGPGVRYVIFVQGCPMRCAYCHNPDTWAMTEGTLTDPADIIQTFENNRPFYVNGGITVTGGEPLMQIDFLIDLFTLAKEHNIHTDLDTSGIAFNPNNPELMKKFDRLMEVTDLVMLDIKHIDPVKHKELTSQPNENILAFVKYLSDKNVDMWIRHVIVPTITDDDEYLYKLGYFVGQFNNLKALDALPYHTMGKPKYEKLGIEYKLADIEPMGHAALLEKKKVILNGIRDRRAELNMPHDDSIVRD